MVANCIECGEEYPVARAQAGYKVCLDCGESHARQERNLWCVAPMHKSNYMLFTNLDDLKGINNKGGLHR